ncbi:MAG: DoxX family protein [Gammaproteobacteria bacterium]|nr:DoxX family protein [Gammaproteobacteria bacterium]
MSKSPLWMDLPWFGRGEDLALALMRLTVGAFLVWGAWDNMVSAARMDEFEAFLAAHGFAAPAFLAPLSVWAQFVCGLALIVGLLTRWAGLICAFNFVVAVIMVDGPNGIRAAFPATILALLGLYFATRGSGRLSIDEILRRRNDTVQGGVGSRSKSPSEDL